MKCLEDQSKLMIFAAQDSEKGLFTFYREEQERSLHLNLKQKQLRSHNKKTCLQESPPPSKRSNKSKNSSTASKKKKKKQKIKSEPVEDGVVRREISIIHEQSENEENNVKEKFLKNILSRKNMCTSMKKTEKKSSIKFINEEKLNDEDFNQYLSTNLPQKWNENQDFIPIRGKKSKRVSTEPVVKISNNDKRVIIEEQTHKRNLMKKVSSLKGNILNAEILEEFAKVKEHFYEKKRLQQKQQTMQKPTNLPIHHEKSHINTSSIKLPQIKQTRLSKALKNIMEAVSKEARPIYRYCSTKTKKNKRQTNAMNSSPGKDKSSLTFVRECEEIQKWKQDSLVMQMATVEVGVSRVSEIVPFQSWSEEKKEALRKLGLKIRVNYNYEQK